ncbi:MAG: DUF3149 domain-containing protein [Gammaproteobacteria bacterium]|nr:MAG: DUF3149 domain-containing protein [Gammaproteobacteria bacterium]
MELWMDLLFGNPIGLLSMIVIFGAIIMITVLFVMFMKKSRED